MAEISGSLFKTKNECSNAEQYGINIYSFWGFFIERRSLYQSYIEVNLNGTNCLLLVSLRCCSRNYTFV